MAARLSTDANMTAQELRTFYAALLIETAKPRILHGKFGKTVNVPLHYGPTINFRKFSDIATTVTALTEGTAGAEVTFTVTSITTSLPEFGQWAYGSQRLFDMAIDDIEGEVTQKLGEAAGKSLDLITLAILRTGTGVVYGGTAAGDSWVASNLSVAMLRKAAFILKRNGADPFVFGGKRRYVGLTTAEALYDLVQDSTLTTAMQYGYGNNLSDNEANLLDGMIAPELDVMGVRLFDTTQAVSAYASSLGWSLTRHIYATMVIGKDAYGVVSQDGNSMKRYFIPAATPDKSDILQQRWYMGWKAVHNAVIMNNSNMVRIEHAISGDLPADVGA
jgi:N4-gp56 family major capsid protein